MRVATSLTMTWGSFENAPPSSTSSGPPLGRSPRPARAVFPVTSRRSSVVRRALTHEHGTEGRWRPCPKTLVATSPPWQRCASTRLASTRIRDGNEKKRMLHRTMSHFSSGSFPSNELLFHARSCQGLAGINPVFVAPSYAAAVGHPPSNPHPLSSHTFDRTPCGKCPCISQGPT